MKKTAFIIITLAIIATLFYIAWNIATRSQTIEVVNEVVATSTAPTLTAIEEAQQKLDAAKKLLDDEEALILAEIEARETRLEQIRDIRLSFSQAPTPAK